MSNATLTLKRTIVRPEGEQSLKDTIVITPQNIVASSGTIVPSSTATQEIVSLSRWMKGNGEVEAFSPDMIMSFGAMARKLLPL